MVRHLKPKKFIFESYNIDSVRSAINFKYSFDNGLKFTDTIKFDASSSDWKKNKPLLDRLAFNLHLARGLSYYKAYCPKKIIIKSGTLDKNGAEFWNNLYTKGLGELFYRNKIDYRGLINFPYQTKTAPQAIHAKTREIALLPWGGGKDSCVSAEILKELKRPFVITSLGDSLIQKKTAALAALAAPHAPRIINEGQIDPKLIALNSEPGVYNGHIPISAIYYWVTALTAVLKGYRYIVFSNEQSANYGNIRYLGGEINHQYSKSLDFENRFRSYLKNYVTPDIELFSLLRPYSELKISSLFVRHKKYFPVFSSCNRNFSLTKKTNQLWCGRCPKCAFVFSQLAAYISRAELVKIFGHDLLDDSSLLPLYQELWGEKKFKPFECVGTPEEVKAALMMTGQRAEWKKDAIVSYFNRRIRPAIKEPQQLIASALQDTLNDNRPANFQKTLILGYGLEGRFVHNYLRRKYPRLTIALADQKKIKTSDKNVILHSGPHYLSALKNYDLIIKSPGLSDLLPELVRARAAGQKINSATNIFLKEFGDRTIGVTGTKGKSTTASLIYKMLKESGRTTYLVGNIGTDPLKYLSQPIPADAVFVYELSSYQLATADYDPHVAVFINIFPDHLPYHHGFVNYFAAKTRIALNQGPSDFLIYNSRYPLITTLAKKSQATKIDYLRRGAVKNDYLYFDAKKIIGLKDIKLLGEHNRENILAAISAAKIYGATDAGIKKALVNFKNLEHRLEFVGKYQGISFYDDAISTTPESTLAALEVFKNKVGTIILGGEDRGYDFHVLAKRLADLRVQNIVLFPDSGRRIAAALKKEMAKNSKFTPWLFFTSKMAEAVKFAYQNTGQGKVCLLSCASPSYSLFKNFKEKGDLFQMAIKKYRNL